MVLYPFVLLGRTETDNNEIRLSYFYFIANIVVFFFR